MLDLYHSVVAHEDIIAQYAKTHTVETALGVADLQNQKIAGV